MESEGNNLIEGLYFQLLESWNMMDATRFADHFSEEGNIVGFDGSQANGQQEIEQHLTEIFRDHRVARYVSIIREIRYLTSDVAILRAVVGMVPPGKTDINSGTNAIQTMIAQKTRNGFRVALFQNTPAAFHGRHDESVRLTNELQAKIKQL